MCHFVTSCRSHVPWIHRFVEKPNVTFSVDTSVDLNQADDPGVVIVMDGAFYSCIKDNLPSDLRTGRDFISSVGENINYQFMVNFVQSYEAATQLTLSYLKIPDVTQATVIKLYTKLVSLHHKTSNGEALDDLLNKLENLKVKECRADELMGFHQELLKFVRVGSCPLSGDFIEAPIKVLTRDKDETILHVFSFEGLREHISQCKISDPINGLPIEDLLCGVNIQHEIESGFEQFKTRLAELAKSSFVN